MKIVWITSGDDLLIAHQFKYYLENNSMHSCRVICFNRPKYDLISDIVVSDLEKLHEEFQLPEALENITSIIKNCDLVISSHGVIPDFESGNFVKLDGHYAVIAGIKIWLLVMDKPKVVVLFDNKTLRNHHEWYANTYKASGCIMVTYNKSVFELLKDRLDIRLLNIVKAEEFLGLSEQLSSEIASNEDLCSESTPYIAMKQFEEVIKERCGLCIF